MFAVAKFDDRLRGIRQDGGQVLSDSLKLQQATQQRLSAISGKRRGRRRRGHVIDIENRVVLKPRPRRLLRALLVAEAAVAAVAVAVLVGYLYLERGSLF
jgi:hypothetical protein